MVRLRMGSRRQRLALGCAVGAAAVTALAFWATSSSVQAPQGAAVGPTGLTRPAFPSLVERALTPATSIAIRNSVGVAATVTRPADVRQIASWLAALPRPVPGSDDPWCSGYRELVVRFDFLVPGGDVALRAVDRLPGPYAGACGGSISFEGHAVAEKYFLSRVSRLIGIDLTANPRTLRHEEAAKRDAWKLLDLVRVPPGSQPLARFRPRIEGPESNSVSARRVWRVRLPLLQVYKWEKAHPPRGSYQGGYSDAVGWDRNNGRPTSSRGDGYTYAPLAGQTYTRELDLNVWHYVHHGAWTQIEANVRERWIVTRPSDERVPRGVRAIVVHGPARLARRITRPDLIARAVHWIDSLPLVQAFSGECGPGRPSRSITIDFLGPTRKPLAVASAYYPGGAEGRCNPLGLRIGGLKRPPLDGGGDPIGEIERLAR